MEIVEILLIFDTAPPDPGRVKQIVHLLRDVERSDSHCAQGAICDRRRPGSERRSFSRREVWPQDSVWRLHRAGCPFCRQKSPSSSRSHRNPVVKSVELTAISLVPGRSTAVMSERPKRPSFFLNENKSRPRSAPDSPRDTHSTGNRVRAQ